MSRAVKFGLLAVVVFGAGAGVAIWQKNIANQNLEAQPSAPVAAADTPVEAAPAPAEAPVAAAPTPAPENAAIEPGKVVDGAPPMPIPAEESAMAAHDHAAAAPAPAPVAGLETAGSFSLTDNKGNAVTEASWPGKTKLVFFGYTSCPDICPATLQKLTTLMETMDPAGAKLQPLFITVDPAHDTAALMDTYLGGYHKSIVGLTGTPAQVDEAKKAYKVYSSANGAGVVDHTSFIYAVSPEGKVLAVMGANAPAEEMIAKVTAATAAP